MVCGSFGVYGIILGGWASNSKYGFMGALRSVSQMISYEVSIGLLLLNFVLCTSSLEIHTILTYQTKQGTWFIWPLFIIFFIFFISTLAEMNRAPFDLPEAEAELVAGYNTEYSGMPFALFFFRRVWSYGIDGLFFSNFISWWYVYGCTSGNYTSCVVWFIMILC